MKTLPLISLLVLLTGCASAPRNHSTPMWSAPAPGKVIAAVSKISAKAPPSMKAETGELTSAIAGYVKQVEDQTEQLNKTTEEKNDAIALAEKWHQKQVKGLKEIWMWRLIFLAEILAVAGWIAWKIYKPRFL